MSTIWFRTTSGRIVLATLALFAISAIVVYSIFGERYKLFAQKPASDSSEMEWVLHDSASNNITNMDPVQIVDAFSINVLSNIYEGLVAAGADGKIIPALAHSWEVSPDGKLWTFHLREGVKFQSISGSCNWIAPTEVTSADVVASLVRVITSTTSVYKWVFADLIDGASSASDGSVAGVSSPNARTVIIRLTRPFPLLSRLVTVAGWVYPKGLIEACGKDYLARNPVGTGPYRLSAFVPDDRIELTRFSSFHGGARLAAPARVEITIQPEPIAALESFKSGRLDVVELSLGTLEEARRLAAARSHRIVSVAANYLDYLVVNNRQQPFDDIRVRRALNAAIDRDALARILSDTVRPAFGFIPPPSPAYRGAESIRLKGFRYAPTEARALLQQYLTEKGIQRIGLELLIDVGDLPEAVGQYVQAALQTNLGVSVKLVKVTWPELLQRAFGSSSSFYRFWWNIVTPSDDLYFQFFFPGREPPQGFNMSFYDSKSFASRYFDVYSELDPDRRIVGIRELEDQLIGDAVAVPLFHKNFFYLVRQNVDLPIDGFLRKSYIAGTRANGAP